MPLSAWLGWTEAPGDVPGYGPVDAEDSRTLASLLARPGNQWCVTLTDTAGHPVAHACARHGPGGKASQGGPGRAGPSPGGPGDRAGPSPGGPGDRASPATPNPGTPSPPGAPPHTHPPRHPGTHRSTPPRTHPSRLRRPRSRTGCAA